MKAIKKTATALALCLAPAAGSAATLDFDVMAQANSSNGGTGLLTGIILGVGDMFSVSAALDDTWVLGAGATRIGNADGLPAFPDFTDDGLTARFGTLVGQIGDTGDFFILGTDFSGAATQAGELRLYAWDSNSGDNSGSILASVTVAAVPVPAAGGLLLTALGLMAARRRS